MVTFKPALSRAREQFDWALFLAIAVIAIAGVVNLYSATSPYIDDPKKVLLADVYVKQVYWLVVGGLLAVVFTVIDYRNFERLAYVAYATGIGFLLLLVVLASGPGESVAIRGAARWIELGAFSFQPSEFMKIVIVLAVARFLADAQRPEARTLFDLAIPITLCAFPAALVAIQPDLGTALIYVLTVACMLSMTRVRWTSVASLVGILGMSGYPLWQYYLHDYQKNRILSFLDPESDKSDTGWHALQSRTAIGNGGVWGEGFREGTQNQFRFLPDQYSDFPFAVFAEDWGFVGCVALLAVYCFICIWSVNIASLAKDRFGAAVAVGIGAMFFWHTFFNVGMVLGVLPVVGITLPLFSYGGSSALSMLIGLGLLMNVSIRR
jgi:rod shape determining protein RodA